MDWVRLDVDFFNHPKIIGLSERAQILYLRALLYCGYHETDWIVPAAFTSKARAKELVEAGLWTSADGGWKIHNADWRQPGLERLQEIRGKRSSAGKLGASKRYGKPLANATANAIANGQQTDSTVTVTSTRTSSSSPVFTHDPPPTAADEMISAALRIIADRRMSGSAARISNLEGYRKIVLDQLREQHHRRIDQLKRDPVVFNGQWTANDVANLLEPQPVKPPAIDFAPGSGKLEWFGSAAK